MIDFLFRKRKLIIRFSSEIKVLPIDPVFSIWVNFNKKVSIINCSTNSKSFRPSVFFFEIQKLKSFEKTSPFFSVSLRSLLFSNCQLAMFCGGGHKYLFELNILMSMKRMGERPRPLNCQLRFPIISYWLMIRQCFPVILTAMSLLTMVCIN